MDYKWLMVAGAGALVFLIMLYYFFFYKKKPCENREAQRLLDEYLGGDLCSAEIGAFYERYIGQLYERHGYYVIYNGALSGFDDLGRDLIVVKPNEVLIVQAKCWAKHKRINEKHIFQLYGSAIHYQETEKCYGKKVRSVFYTSAKYSDVAREAAEVLGVELQKRKLDREYPLVKCNVNKKGEKIYHLPFDPYYDKVRIDPDQGEFFVNTVEEAVEKGFRRARSKNKKVA